jgi:hypothetical protein
MRIISTGGQATLRQLKKELKKSEQKRKEEKNSIGETHVNSD